MPNDEKPKREKTPDEKLGLWLVLGSPLFWCLGVASFGGTGNIFTVLLAPLGCLSPFAFIFGLYLLIKSQIVQDSGKEAEEENGKIKKPRRDDHLM